MSAHLIGLHGFSVQQIRARLESSCLNSIRGVLPDDAIRNTCRVVGHHWRNRRLTPVIVVLAMIAAAIWPENSFQAAWQLLWDNLRALLPEADAPSPTSGSLAKARARLPLKLWQHLFQWLSDQIRGRTIACDLWRNLRLVLLDGTTLSMPDTPRLFQVFGSNSSRGKRGKFPLLRLVALSLAGSMTVIHFALGAYTQSEVELAAQILHKLKRGDLLIADRFFASAHAYARYLKQNLHFIIRKHECLKADRLPVLVRFSRYDKLVQLQVGKTYRRLDPSLPEAVTVRLISFHARIRGKRTPVHLVTSLLDPFTYPAAEIIQLYSRRWRIETLLKQFKHTTGADVLRSATPDGVRKEVIARLMALNIVRLIMLDAAQQEGVDPTRLSFVGAVRSILHFAPHLAAAPVARLSEIYQAMLSEIARHVVPYRPSRNEPRMIRREKKHYPSLKTTRKQWRQTLEESYHAA